MTDLIVCCDADVCAARNWLTSFGLTPAAAELAATAIFPLLALTAASIAGGSTDGSSAKPSRCR